ncbi:hypothetical protein [Enterococcus avium]|uniref:hypothetical protein n=1 Tax=Enterococcus avium TaxID=33945 RepID=UPI001F570487|nr:hypothetical protein [Enterococcus avium]
MNDILTQLQQECLCINIEDKNKDRVLKALERAFALFSTFTCGAGILSQTKTERRRLYRKCDCSCDDDYTRFYPFYPNPHNYSVSIETIDGLNVSLDPAPFVELLDGGLKVDISKAPCRRCTCDESFLVVQYDAFWELIPDDLLPFFCDLVNVLLTIQKVSCGSCKKCENFNNSDIGKWVAENAIGVEDSYYNLEKYIYGYYDRILRKYSLCKKIRVFGVKAGGVK